LAVRADRTRRFIGGDDFALHECNPTSQAGRGKTRARCLAWRGRIGPALVCTQLALV
jgi:hypothetical protein